MPVGEVTLISVIQSPITSMPTRMKPRSRRAGPIRAQISRSRPVRPTFSGRHYSVTEAINQPVPLSRIPVMIGGSGERKTLRMVAQYADMGNLTCDPSEVPRKLDALAGHCERLGRDRSEILVSLLRVACIAPTTAEAEADRDAYLANRGMVWADLPEELRQMISGMMVIGDPDTITTALGIPGGALAVVRTAGGTTSVTPRERVEITAVRDVPRPTWATPVPADEAAAAADD